MPGGEGSEEPWDRGGALNLLMGPLRSDTVVGRAGMGLRGGAMVAGQSLCFSPPEH